LQLKSFDNVKKRQHLHIHNTFSSSEEYRRISQQTQSHIFISPSFHSDVKVLYSLSSKWMINMKMKENSWNMNENEQKLQFSQLIIQAWGRDQMAFSVDCSNIQQRCCCCQAILERNNFTHKNDWGHWRNNDNSKWLYELLRTHKMWWHMNT